MARKCSLEVCSGGLALGLLGLAAAGCGGGSSGPGAVVGGGATQVAFQTIQNAILTPSCAVTDCHVGVDAPFGLDMSQGQALGNLIGVPSAEQPQFDRIAPSDPTNSYLYMKVTADPRISGDRMPAFAGPLSDDDIDLIARWIQQGAQP